MTTHADEYIRTDNRSLRGRLLDNWHAWQEQSGAIARKELAAYFGSPMALIFVAAFLVVTLFAFFWVETFFARGIADVRPLFRWMPALMIFLVAALTMRQWSEEQRSGTLEILLTLPVRRSSLVAGKFIAAMALVAVALALTLFQPITVDILGQLDWGPVIGGYLAALLMASAYVAIGLLVSSRTDNQIVSLIVTLFLCGAFYLVGSQSLTALVGETPAEILRAIGTGSRFASIERGVIDLRDLVYYGSLTALFLSLTVLSLDSKRWSRRAHAANKAAAAYRRNAILSVVLVGANLLAANVWLFPIRVLRLDLTAQREYSLSPVTRDLIRNLQEPLLLRGYFSDKTHPLLAPLVPTIRDMLQEYAIASGGKIKVQVLDPKDNPELEAEANQTYGIRPVPFRISGRYEDTVINSYFDILVQYGDQSAVLGFQDLIEVESSSTGQVGVKLRNLEYDLTRSIKKTVYGFQSLDAVLARMSEPVQLTAYITQKTLPSSLAEVVPLIQKIAQDLQQTSQGKLTFRIVDPDADSTVTRQSLYDTYGIQPFAVSLFSADTYYLHLVLQVGQQADPKQAQILYPGPNTSEAELRTEIESALKRVAPGFLKTVGLWTPSEQPVPDPYTGSSTSPIATWSNVRTQLAQNYTVESVDLSSGRVGGNIDVLAVIAPQGMTDRELYAIDQYLMRGGAVVVAAGNYVLSPQQYGGGIAMDAVQGGLKDLLAGYGITVTQSMVMDPQNEPFPIQVQRQVQGMSVVEIQQLKYPYFVDVRQNGMAADSPIVASLPAITLQWTSALEIDEAKNQGRQVTVLLRSTANSWLRSDLNVTPDTTTYPEYGFPVEGEKAARPLAVSVRGRFDSYFKGRPSPLQVTPTPAADQSPAATATPAAGNTPEAVAATIDASPDSARLVVVGSSEFLNDTVLDISRNISQDRYLNNLQFLQNAIDWTVEDEDLLTIRSRGTYAHLLRPMVRQEQSLWEGLNYGLAVLGVIGIGIVWNVRRRNEQPIALVDAGPAIEEGQGDQMHSSARNP
jgi:ABC-2 type transport system permease protein